MVFMLSFLLSKRYICAKSKLQPDILFMKLSVGSLNMNNNEFENLDDEVKELLQNYRFRKATAYEPCTLKNFKECLIGLHEEFQLFNIDYSFNPYTDVMNGMLTPEALVQLVNSVWALLHRHKNTTDKVDKLMEQNHILEHNNKHLTCSMIQIKEKLNIEKHESKACVASAQRVSDQSHEVYQKLVDTRSKLRQLTKQKETNDKYLQNKIARLQLENDKLMDKLRNKSGSYTPCADICDSTMTQLKDRERKHRVLVAQLQANNQDLIREVLALKEEIVLEGISNVKLTE